MTLHRNKGINMTEVSKKVCVLLSLFTANMLFAECGLIGYDGSIHPNADLLDATTLPNNNFFQTKNCDDRKCGYAFLLHNRQDQYGCSSKEEYVRSVKKLFDRDIHVKESKKIFSYAGIAKKYSDSQIRLGCDFVKLKPEYTDFSLTGYAYPDADGLCPIFLNQEKNNFYFLIFEKKKNYEIKLKVVREIHDKSSELVYFSESFLAYVKPCVEKQVRFSFIGEIAKGG